MKLTLGPTQRLNLQALLGAQRADVGSTRAIWAIQDRIALDAVEEKAVEVKREMTAGQERIVWNPALSIPAKDFEFSDPEVARMKAANPDLGLVRRKRRPTLAPATGLRRCSRAIQDFDEPPSVHRLSPETPSKQSPCDRHVVCFLREHCQFGRRNLHSQMRS
jgi:hypothetical protein